MNLRTFMPIALIVAFVLAVAAASQSTSDCIDLHPRAQARGSL